jgi:hypothetical protein
MTGMPHALETLKIRIGTPGVLRRTLGVEARTVITPTEEIVHCHLCGASHRARANHLCPRLYGR